MITLHHTATYCNILQHTTTHYNAMHRTATHCTALQHTATHCIALQHTATHQQIFEGLGEVGQSFLQHYQVSAHLCLYRYIHICIYVYMYVYIYMYMRMYTCAHEYDLDSLEQYGVATISRLLKNIGLFCRI